MTTTTAERCPVIPKDMAKVCGTVLSITNCMNRQLLSFTGCVIGPSWWRREMQKEGVYSIGKQSLTDEAVDIWHDFRGNADLFVCYKRVSLLQKGKQALQSQTVHSLHSNLSPQRTR